MPEEAFSITSFDNYNPYVYTMTRYSALGAT